MNVANQYNLEMSINLFLHNFNKGTIIIKGHNKDEIYLIIKNNEKIYEKCLELIKAISLGYKKLEVIAYVEDNNIVIPKRNITLEILAVYFDIMKCGIFLENNDIENLNFLNIVSFNTKEDYLHYSSITHDIDNYSFIKKEPRKKRKRTKTDKHYCVDIKICFPTFNIIAKNRYEAKNLIYEKLKNTSVMKFVKKCDIDVCEDWRF